MYHERPSWLRASHCCSLDARVPSNTQVIRPTAQEIIILFVICSTCQRHVLADAPDCPFCAKRSARRGLLSRRAVGALAVASLGAAACGPAEPPPASPTVDAPTQDPPEEPLVQEEAPPDLPPEEETDVVVEETTPEPAPADVDIPVDRPVARYGVAPRPVSTSKPQTPSRPQRPVARYGLAPR